MEKINLILSIISSILAIISASCSYNFYKKTLKIYNSNNNITQKATNNAIQIAGNKNKVK